MAYSDINLQYTHMSDHMCTKHSDVLYASSVGDNTYTFDLQSGVKIHKCFIVLDTPNLIKQIILDATYRGHITILDTLSGNFINVYNKLKKTHNFVDVPFGELHTSSGCRTNIHIELYEKAKIYMFVEYSKSPFQYNMEYIPMVKEFKYNISNDIFTTHHLTNIFPKVLVNIIGTYDNGIYDTNYDVHIKTNRRCLGFIWTLCEGLKECNPIEQVDIYKIDNKRDVLIMSKPTIYFNQIQPYMEKYKLYEHINMLYLDNLNSSLRMSFKLNRCPTSYYTLYMYAIHKKI